MIADRALAVLAAAVAIACAVGALAQTVRLSTTQVDLANAKTKLATEQRGREADRAAAAGAAASAIAAYRAEEQRRAAALQETVDVAQTDAALARKDARSAAGAAERLRQHVAALAASCRGGPSDTATASSGAPAAGAGLVLAQLFQRADDRAGELAQYADQARIAGAACERAYEALR